MKRHHNKAKVLHVAFEVGLMTFGQEVLRSFMVFFRNNCFGFHTEPWRGITKRGYVGEPLRFEWNVRNVDVALFHK